MSRRWQQLLALDPFWIVLFLVVTTWVLVPGQSFRSEKVEEGSVATRDHLAPRDALILDREATSEKQRRATEEVLPVFDYDPATTERVVGAISTVFESGRTAIRSSSDEEEEPEAISLSALEAVIEEAARVDITAGQVAFLRDQRFSSSLEDRLEGLVEQVLQRGVVAGKTSLLESRGRGVVLRNLQSGTEQRQLDVYGYLDYPEEVREILSAELRSWSDLDPNERGILLELLGSTLRPNLHLNQSETVRRQEEAAASVERVYNRIHKGQIIVRKGDQIDARAAQLINELSGTSSWSGRMLPALGIFLFLALLALVLWLGVRKERVTETKRETALGEALLLLLLSIVGAKVCQIIATGLASSIEAVPFDDVQSYYFAVPFAALALVAVLLYGRGLALLMGLVFSMIAGLVVEESSWGIVVFALSGSMAAILTVDHFQFKQRSIMVRAGGVVAVVNAVTVLMLAAIGGDLEGGGSRLILQILCALLGGVLVSAAASFLVPVLESVFSVTTGIKLVELANTNLPLLRRLAFEAPGTFQHSLMVANLSKAGCEAIGADSVLAYTGALYHDIGKIFRPEYFVENQRSGYNRHEKLLPSMSALILINHVKEGLELAREYHLPEPILDAIGEHHGTRLISFFFNKAKEMQDPQSGEVAEEKYRYPGPKPRSKVMGVLMLADGVEAAARTLDDASASRIRTVIKTITDDCLRDGQLDETDLTLGDLNRIAEAFQRILAHIHHRRLDYPGFEFNERGGRKPKGEAIPGRKSGESPRFEVVGGEGRVATPRS